MSIVRDIERALAGVLLALVVCLAAYAWWQGQRLETVTQDYRQAAGDARAATVYVTAHKAAQKEKEAKNVEVEARLEEHRDWADAPVPDDVAGLLRHRTGTTRAVP